MAKRKQSKLHKLAVERTSKYWICDECAASKKWVAPSWPVTATLGLCGYCDRPDEIGLIPIVDYKRGNKEPIWD